LRRHQRNPSRDSQRPPGIFLDDDGVAALDELIGRRRRQRDPKFLLLDFLWDADLHWAARQAAN
jgi:hypothetical protein